MTAFAKRQVLFLLLSFILCSTAQKLLAQKLFFLYAHGVYANPVDKNFKDGYHAGLGVEAGAAIGWNKTFIVGTAGYTSFSDKDNNATGNISYAPVKIGIRQYVFSKFIYVHGDLGIGKIKNDVLDDTRLSGNIGAGVKLAGFEVQLDYDGFIRKSPEASGYASWIGIKAGFNLGL